MPIWISNCTPSLVWNISPCFVLMIETILPSSGAYTFPSIGLIAIPSPIVLSAKVLSGTSLNDNTFPEIGAYTVVGVWTATCSTSDRELSFTWVVFSARATLCLPSPSNPITKVKTKDKIKDTKIIITPNAKFSIGLWPPIKAGNANKQFWGIYKVTWRRPPTKSPIPAAIVAATKGRFNLSVTP